MIIDAVFNEEEAFNADFGVLTKGDKGDKGDAGVVDYSLVANAIKGKASGEVVALTDVSPLEHEMAVKVSQGGATVKKYGLNVIDSDAVFSKLGYVKQEDGSWLGRTLHGNVINLPKKYKGAIYVQAEIKNTGKKGAPFQLIAYYAEGGNETLISLAQSQTEYTSFKKASDANKTVSYIMVSQGGANEAIAGAFYIRDFMISYADGEYEPYVEPTTYTADENGIVSGVTSLYPSTTLLTDTEGVTIEAEYNKDINKVVNDIYQKLSALGVAVVNN